MNNFQTHMLLVVGVSFIEIVFFTVIAVVGGNSGSFVSSSPANTSTTPAPNISSSSTPRQGFDSNSRTNSSPATSPATVNVAALQDKVISTLNDWKSAAEAHDLNSYMSYYADTIDYYKAKGWDKNRIRVDKQRAFSMYDQLRISLENISVSLDSSHEHAIVIMDKTWTFTGAGKSTTGSVQQQITLVKSGERWLITGEKDMKVYYSRSY